MAVILKEDWAKVPDDLVCTPRRGIARRRDLSIILYHDSPCLPPTELVKSPTGSLHAILLRPEPVNAPSKSSESLWSVWSASSASHGITKQVMFPLILQNSTLISLCGEYRGASNLLAPAPGSSSSVNQPRVIKESRNCCACLRCQTWTT